MAKYRNALAGFILVLLVFWVSSLASAKSLSENPISNLSGLADLTGFRIGSKSGLVNNSTSWPDRFQLLQTQPISPTETLFEVNITDEGIFPPVLTFPPDVTIRWTNQTSQTQRLAGSLSTGSGSQIIYLPLIFKDLTGQNSSVASGESPATSNLASQDTNWQSGDILPGSSFSRTFDQPGEYTYSLTDSPTLTGTVVIEGQSDPSIASVLMVTTTADDRTVNGNCTLREAIIAANTNKAVDACPAGGYSDTIILGSDIYSLTLKGNNEDAAATGDLDIKSKITVVGASDGQTTIDASRLSDRVFHILGSGNAIISKVTFINGRGYGAGIFNVGTLTLNSSTIRNNSTDDGGGGLKNDGQATINSSTISDNSASFAAGIFNRGILKVNNSTISGNTAQNIGGGIKNEGTLTLKHTTLTNNTAHQGGGIINFYYGTVKFQNSIIVGNIAPDEPEFADCSDFQSGSLGYNLVGNNTGCPTINTDLKVNPADVFTTVLGPLQDNGGNILTHALLLGSPALDVVPLDKCIFAADQRGVARPQGTACDIGAFELEPTDPAQTGPIFTVNTADDTDDGVCSVAHCSLREAIKAANARPNSSTPDEIHFNIPTGGPQTIQPASALSAITDPVKIDGSTQPGFVNVPIITLDGSQATTVFNGLDFSAGNSAVQNLVIHNFGGAGIQITGGISHTTILSNTIFNNGGLGIDLGGDGVTPNDIGTLQTGFDPDQGANNLQNFPLLTGAFPDGSNTRIEGRLNSIANAQFTLEFFANPTCDPSNFGEGQTFLGSISLTTDNSGDAIFTGTAVSFPVAIPQGQFVTATATGPDGTSEFSQCVPVSLGNDSWPTALRLNLSGNPLAASFDQYVDKEGQSRWFKFTVQPNSQVIVTLTDLPENYDLTVYKDIDATFKGLISPEVQDLIQLNAEFANDGFAADSVARGSRSPDALARGSRSPDAFAANVFSPDAIARGSRSPDDFARGSRSPDVFAPDAFAPDAYTPDALARGSRSPDEIARGSRSPEAFSSAQTLSLIGVSAFDGTASEGIMVNTWNNTGDFYVRVKGRNGAFSLVSPFHLEVTLITGTCGNIQPVQTPSNTTVTAGNYQTIILTDLGRMEGTPDEKAALQARLVAFAARPEVAGVVVNVGADARVVAANTQADNNLACPYAKNLVAEAIKDIIDRYRTAPNPLRYVVIVGNDNVIPFFRHPDRALLGPESDYVPPVFDFTASQASLKLNYVLGQDFYGSQVDLSLQLSTLPIPDLAVGRLVETASDASRMVDAYLITPNGVVTTPTSALVTGYDFFADAAVEIQSELENGLGIPPGTADILIAPREASPQDPRAWTASQLAAQLLDRRHDVVFLGGHFSASSALAADYETRLLSTDLVSSPVNLENALIFSIGCHSGYNVVNQDGIPGVTAEPDWAQAFAEKGATLIAGTGYQYGDTDFLEYSERIYREFSRQLRTGSGPVSIGQALVTAKQIYLAQTPQLRALHEKSLLETTLFGLPMLSINMPGNRLTPASDNSIVPSVASFNTDPGSTLNLKYADVEVTPAFDESVVELEDIEDNSTVEALILRGRNGLVTNPNEPALPLEMRNVSGPGNLVLRGVGFRGGDYVDTPNVQALVGAPTTEIRSIHTPFFSDIFYPTQPWSVNYFDALTNVGGTTRLAAIPAQFKSTTPNSEANTLRKFTKMNFRLYYSDNTAAPALVAAPVIAKVAAPLVGGGVNFRINVIGSPEAGIQEVWVNYTTVCAPNSSCNRSWQSLDLIQNGEDSTLWEGSLGTATPQDIRYIVQAVNGVGLVSLATNLGAYYIPGVDETNLQATALSLDPPASTSGPYGSEATFSAVLMAGTTPLSGQVVIFGLGAQSDLGITDGNGRATVTLPLLGLPDTYEVRASFPGTAANAAASAPNTFQFEITKQDSILCLEPDAASNDDQCDSQPISGRAGDNRLVVATLTDALGQRLFEKTVVFVVSGSGGTYRASIITDYAGRAALGNIPLPPGDYTINAYFNGDIPVGNNQTVTLNDARYRDTSVTGALTLINTPPVAVNDAYSVNEDHVLTVAASGVLSNDTDIDSASLTAVLVSGPTNGVLSLNPAGSFVYTPTLNFNGTDSFTYQANDGNLDSNVTTVTLTINPVNDAPVANNDVYTVTQKSKLIVAAPGVLANDTDIDSPSLTALRVSGPSHGSLTLQTSGAFTYTPTHGFQGTDIFTYQANDGIASSNVATVTITVKPKPLDCSVAKPNPAIIWSPNNKFISVAVTGITGSNEHNDDVKITIVSIFQDEPVGKDKFSPDGQGIGSGTAKLRAQRDGAGNGRVYHISFTAADKQGGFCSGEVRVAVPHDQSGPVDLNAIDGGALYDSTKKSR